MTEYTFYNSLTTPTEHFVTIYQHKDQKSKAIMSFGELTEKEAEELLTILNKVKDRIIYSQEG